jgi:Ca2+-binding EF-hand superfamily protein
MKKLHAFVAIGVLAWSGVACAQAAKAPITKPVRTAAEVTFDAWDKDHNGQLSREEFRAGWERAQQHLQAEARLRQHFATVDANKSGALEPAEYATLELVKKAAKDAPMSRFDLNKDGKLQFGEYLRLVQVLSPANVGAAK